jgi:hypothetical protein
MTANSVGRRKMPVKGGGSGRTRPRERRTRPARALRTFVAPPTRGWKAPTRGSDAHRRGSAERTRGSALPTRRAGHPTRDAARPTRGSSLPTRSVESSTPGSGPATPRSALTTRGSGAPRPRSKAPRSLGGTRPSEPPRPHRGSSHRAPPGPRQTRGSDWIVDTATIRRGSWLAKKTGLIPAQPRYGWCSRAAHLRMGPTHKDAGPGLDPAYFWQIPAPVALIPEIHVR